jgi:hypothetical protein
VRLAPTTGVPLIVGGEVFTGAFRVFAAELPLAKNPKETASTPAVANQVFRDPTAGVSAHDPCVLTGLPPLKEGCPDADRSLVGPTDAGFFDEYVL